METLTKLLDPALIGVLIGALIPFLQNLLTQISSNCKEERQWNRQRQANKEDIEQNMLKQENEYLREIYHKCLSLLSVFISIVQENEKQDGNNEKKIELNNYIKEIHNWISLLLLRHYDKELGSSTILVEPNIKM